MTCPKGLNDLVGETLQRHAKFIRDQVPEQSALCASKHFSQACRTRSDMPLLPIPLQLCTVCRTMKESDSEDYDLGHTNRV